MKTTLPVLLLASLMAWVAMGAGPQQRLERACSPINGVRSTLSSAFAFYNTEPGWLDGKLGELDFLCIYTLWDAVYGAEVSEADKQRHRAAMRAGALP